jgi:hypothetical protein
LLENVLKRAKLSAPTSLSLLILQVILNLGLFRNKT